MSQKIILFFSSLLFCVIVAGAALTYFLLKNKAIPLYTVNEASLINIVQQLGHPVDRVKINRLTAPETNDVLQIVEETGVFLSVSFRYSPDESVLNLYILPQYVEEMGNSEVAKEVINKYILGSLLGPLPNTQGKTPESVFLNEEHSSFAEYDLYQVVDEERW